MGLFDRLRGKAKSEDDAAASMSSAEAAAAVSPSLDLTEQPAAPGPSARQQAFSKQFGVAASEELYNPYEGEFGLPRPIGGLPPASAHKTLRMWARGMQSVPRHAAGSAQRGGAAAAAAGPAPAACKAPCGPHPLCAHPLACLRSPSVHPTQAWARRWIGGRCGAASGCPDSPSFCSVRRRWCISARGPRT